MTAETATEPKPEAIPVTAAVRGFVDPAARAALYRAVATFLPACEHDLRAALANVQTATIAAIEADGRKPADKALQRGLQTTLASVTEESLHSAEYGFLPPIIRAGFGKLTLGEHLALSAIRIRDGKVDASAIGSLQDAAAAVMESLK